MSRNNKYIEDFDRRAGEPAGFDSLFSFDGNELTAKRRIKVRSRTKRLAAACTAAAVMAAAVFAGLTYINTEGLSQSTGVNENADPVTGISETKNEPLLLSGITGKFDYSAAGDLSGLYSSASLVEFSDSPNAVIRFTVASKAYVTDGNGGTLVYYSLLPKEWFIKEGLEANIGESVSVCTASAEGREFQKSSEYIAAFNITEADGASVYTLSGSGFARKTEQGWLGFISGSDIISRALQNEGEAVRDDISGTGNYRLIRSQQKLTEKLYNALSEDNSYQYTSATFLTAYTDTAAESVTTYDFSGIFKNADFESVRYENDSDKSLLVLDNEQYFTLTPGLSGYVIFAGKGDNGSLMAAIEITPIESFPAVTVMFSGLSELTVTSGKIIDESTQIGSCDSAPVYVMITDNRGEPVNVNIEL